MSLRHGVPKNPPLGVHPQTSSKVPYTLPSSVSSNSFICHSYENCRGVYPFFPFWHRQSQILSSLSANVQPSNLSTFKRSLAIFFRINTCEPLVTVDSKRLTQTLNPLDATLMKKPRGEGIPENANILASDAFLFHFGGRKVATGKFAILTPGRFGCAAKRLLRLLPTTHYPLPTSRSLHVR
jgi:hypothetical protein